MANACPSLDKVRSARMNRMSGDIPTTLVQYPVREPPIEPERSGVRIVACRDVEEVVSRRTPRYRWLESKAPIRELPAWPTPRYAKLSQMHCNLGMNKTLWSYGPWENPNRITGRKDQPSHSGRRADRLMFEIRHSLPPDTATSDMAVVVPAEGLVVLPMQDCWGVKKA